MLVTNKQTSNSPSLTRLPSQPLRLNLLVSQTNSLASKTKTFSILKIGPSVYTTESPQPLRLTPWSPRPEPPQS